MKTSTNIFITVIAVFSLSITFCSNYEDAESVLADYAQVIEDYTVAMESADNSRDVVAAINSVTDAMRTLIPEMQRVLLEYPELSSQEEHPIAIKQRIEKFSQVDNRYELAMSKTEQYLGDPNVQEALQEYRRVLWELIK